MILYKKENITGYCDGSKKGKGGKGCGGWGWIYSYSTSLCTIEVSGYGSKKDVTISEMELVAFLECLNNFPVESNQKYTICTDSKYVSCSFARGGKDTITSDHPVSGWVAFWSKNGWKKADKKPVMHVELMKQIVDRIETLVEHGGELTIKWIPRDRNKEADALANKGSDECKNEQSEDE